MTYKGNRVTDDFIRDAWEMAYIFRQLSPDGVAPTWFVTDGEEMEIVMTAFDQAHSYEDKKAASREVAKLVTEMKATRVAFISDVWTRTVKTDSAQEEMKKAPSQQFDSVEAIVAQVWDADKTGYIWMRQYRQNDMGEFEIIDEIHSHGTHETETFSEVLEALYANG
jgi:hypothetical protein